MKVAYWLGVPRSKRYEIENLYSTERERKCAMGKYWVQTNDDASWEMLAGMLYRCDENAALEAAKQFLTTVRGMLTTC